MLRHLSFAVLLVFLRSVWAIPATLQLPSPQTNTFLDAANKSSLSTFAGVENVSAPPVLQISCNANAYGQNLRVPSCRKAAGLIAMDDSNITFADRGSTIRHDIPLTYRIQSGE